MVTSGIVMLASAGVMHLAGPAAPRASPRIVTAAYIRPQPDISLIINHVKSVDARAALAAYEARQERIAAERKARLLAEERQQAAAAAAAAARQQQAAQYPPASAGTYSYSGLEALWEQEGGSSGTAATAACIAEHESSGNPDADNGTDLGLWQIDPGNFPGQSPDALLSAGTNAADAVSLSDDGTNWSDWQTAPDCGV
jgi:hypothetical protein